jgi:hypothetical protein
VSWIFDRAHGRSEILIVHHVVPIEHRSGAVPGHPHHHRLGDAVLRGHGTSCSRPPTPTSGPWFIVPSDDKRRARLNCIHHLLSQIDYRKVPREKVKLSDRSMKNAYDDRASLKGRRVVP